MTSDSHAPAFRAFFKQATEVTPYPYQERLAVSDPLPQLLNIPTGLGKTAAVILAWLWRRRFADKETRAATPRRLVYCLPMRVLVEQTFDNTQEWLTNGGLFAELPGDSNPADVTGWEDWNAENDADTARIAVSLLMGGEETNPWDRYPEHDAILIGTQDMLLSRALNRGYGMSRYRWPMHFGLLHNDCLWVMDETQLMGIGLTTTAQLQGLRAKLATYGITQSLWMSATLDASPIRTVDHPEPPGGFAGLSLSDEDRQHVPVEKRLGARKTLEQSNLVLTSESEKKTQAKELAAGLQAAHRPSTLTLVVLNRVARAQEVFAELEKLAKKNQHSAELALIHARFRPHDRRQQEAKLFSDTLPDAGRIVVATQAIEAGVDVSSATLFTELAPWPSLVQRFGRCNRGGEFSDARVVWIDIQWKDDKDKVSLPYDSTELDRSRQFLAGLGDVGPEALAPLQKKYTDEFEPPVAHTVRRKDLFDLWDTTPDLAGNDLDISRFIRDSDDTDVQFYWREWDADDPPTTLPAPERGELCAVAIGRTRDFLKRIHEKTSQRARVWNPLEKRWRSVKPDEVRPGMVLLLQPAMGGYLDAVGWTGDPKDKPTHLAPPASASPNDGNPEDPDAQKSRWVQLNEHLEDVVTAVRDLQMSRDDWSAGIPWPVLITAASWHDVGKAHPAFQNMLLKGRDDAESRRAMMWAKSSGSPNGRLDYWVDGANGRETRIGFRHELASALAWLARHGSDANADLAAFLIAAHHGKVRVSIRSLPNEESPSDESRKFARGVWDGDTLPSLQVPADGHGPVEEVPATMLDLGLMKLGEGPTGQSWLARVLAIRAEFGPFRLSFLELLLRVADWRGTEKGEQRL